MSNFYKVIFTDGMGVNVSYGVSLITTECGRHGAPFIRIHGCYITVILHIMETY
jgi:hypothetical protein